MEMSFRHHEYELVSPRQIGFRHRDGELISLGNALHEAVLDYWIKRDAFPEGADDDCALTDAAAAPAYAIAEKIDRMSANSGPGMVIKARAAAWLEYAYWEALRH